MSWTAATLGEISDIQTGPFGSQLHSKDYTSGEGTPIVTVEHLGERALAITNVVRNISGISFMVVSAFASTCSALVSNLIGAGHEEAVLPTVRKHVLLAYSIVLP